MTAAVAWRAVDGSDRWAASVSCADSSIASLARSLADARSSLRAACSFLVLDVSDRSEGWLVRTCEVAGQLAFDRRVVVAVRPCDLPPPSHRLPWPARVGLVLDVPDARVSLADLLDDRLDAVRFGPDLIEAAGAQLRTGLAVDTMLALVRSLGLPSLGPDPERDVGPWSADASFDYVASGSGRAARQPEDRPSQFGFEFSR